MSGHAQQLASQALTGGISGGAGGIDAGAATSGDATAELSLTFGPRSYRSGLDTQMMVVIMVGVVLVLKVLK